MPSSGSKLAKAALAGLRAEGGSSWQPIEPSRRAELEALDDAQRVETMRQRRAAQIAQERDEEEKRRRDRDEHARAYISGTNVQAAPSPPPPPPDPGTAIRLFPLILTQG